MAKNCLRFTTVEQLVRGFHRGGSRKESVVTDRHLTITLQSDWEGALRAAAEESHQSHVPG
jgi:hypothetical protein